MIQKLALGTAQFGMHYGINNHTGQPSLEQAHEILACAHEHGIRVLDTASAYGCSEKVIGQLLPNFSDFRVISKYNEKSGLPLKSAFESSLRDLGQNSLHAYLFHNADFVIQNPHTYRELLSLKNDGLVAKIGVSVYTPQQVEALILLKIKPDIIQFPYSIFDQRFDNILRQLKDLDIELHARSIFLQGLLLKSHKELGEYFTSIAPKIKQLEDLALLWEVPVFQLCLQFGLANPLIDQVVIGVDSKENLLNNLRLPKIQNPLEPHSELAKSFRCTDENIILPFRWKR